MTVTTKTIVSFVVGDEDDYQMMEEFKRINDMSEWHEESTTQMISYVQSKTFVTEKHEVEDDE